MSAIREAGVRAVMVTGDNALTRRAWRSRWGFRRSCPPRLCTGICAATRWSAESSPGCFPKTSSNWCALQRRGAVVGMSGDGVNDAAALRQAEAGIAVANATDVAKAAAAMVLTRPGLGDVPAAIETSRRVFQRIITYTLDMLPRK